MTAQAVPMTVDEALKAAETYMSTINGSMVDVLAREVVRLRAIVAQAQYVLNGNQAAAEPLGSDESAPTPKGSLPNSLGVNQRGVVCGRTGHSIPGICPACGQKVSMWF
jgi:hypothetical protein